MKTESSEKQVFTFLTSSGFKQKQLADDLNELNVLPKYLGHTSTDIQMSDKERSNYVII